MKSIPAAQPSLQRAQSLQGTELHMHEVQPAAVLSGSGGYVQDLLARADAAHVVVELDAARRDVELALLDTLLLVAFVLPRALRCTHPLLSVLCRRWRSNPSGKCSQERLTRGRVTSTMRRAAHPSGCARCGAGDGCSAIKYQSQSRVFQPRWLARKERRRCRKGGCCAHIVQACC